MADYGVSLSFGREGEAGKSGKSDAGMSKDQEEEGGRECEWE